jgi:hypothetical protein
MTIDTLAITLTSLRAIDGFIATLNSENEGSENPRTLEEFVLQHITAMGRGMADSKKIGTISSAEFVLRFTPQEYGGIVAAAQQSPELAALLNELRVNPQANMDDPRLLPGLQMLVAAGLLAAERIPQLTAYDRPEVG